MTSVHLRNRTYGIRLRQLRQDVKFPESGKHGLVPQSSGAAVGAGEGG